MTTALLTPRPAGTSTTNFTVFLDVVNLLDEQKVEFNNPFRRIGNETFGQRMFLGVRAKF